MTNVDKMSISLPADLGEEVRELAASSGLGLSGWLAQAAAERVRQENLQAFLDQYEAECGEFTEEELAAARRKLGYE